MGALVAEMALDSPGEGLHPPGPADADAAGVWLVTQERGWTDGDWLTFAVFECHPSRRARSLVGQVGVKPREGAGPVARCGLGEVSYWTAAAARGRGIAPAALDAVTTWAFEEFAPKGLHELWLVHERENEPSCRVAAKSGYEFLRISPANPPHWFRAGHIHSRRRP